MLKILKGSLKFQMYNLDLEKTEEQEVKLSTPKSLIVWITTKCGKFLKRWEYQTT